MTTSKSVDWSQFKEGERVSVTLVGTWSRRWMAEGAMHFGYGREPIHGPVNLTQDHLTGAVEAHRLNQNARSDSPRLEINGIEHQFDGSCGTQELTDLRERLAGEVASLIDGLSQRVASVVRGES